LRGRQLAARGWTFRGDGHRRAAGEEPRHQALPHRGILYEDITTLSKNAEALAYVVDELAERYKHEQVEVVAGSSRAASVLSQPPVPGCGRAAMEPPP